MKKFLLAVPLFFTGCASVGSHIQDRIERSLMNPIELAQRDCTTMGFRTNTPQFQQCVMTTANNIRNNRAAIAAAEAARPQQSILPRTVTCGRVGSYIHCSEN